MLKNLEMLKSTVAQMKTCGISPDENLRDALKHAENPLVKIAFVGKFQAGKSHIINKLFFGDQPLLQEGHGLCMSAIPVAVTYGEAPHITLYDKINHEILTISNPDREKISPLIAAEDEEEREDIFNRFENVVLEYPNLALQNVVVLDTPGINDPNDLLLRETTYRVLPDVDTIVMVVEPRTLSKIELSFLQKKVFSGGINRFMMVISCKPQNLLNETGLATIVQEVKNQLTAIGKSEIPVFVYSDASTPETCENNAEKIKDSILNFAQNYAAENRAAKIVKRIQNALGEEMCRLKLQSTIYGKNQNELNCIKIKAVERLNEMRSALASFSDEFEARASLRRKNCQMGFELDLLEIKEAFLKKLQETDAMSDAQNNIAIADNILIPRIEDAAISRIGQFQKDIEDIFAVMKKELRNRWENAHLGAGMEELDGGWVQNWNSMWITLGDYLLSVLVLPGGLFLSLGLRFVLGKIPVLKDFMPSNLLKAHMINVVEESLNKQLAHIEEDFENELVAIQNKVSEFIQEESRREISRQQLVLETIKDQEQSVDTQNQILSIQSKIANISDLLEQFAPEQ